MRNSDGRDLIFASAGVLWGSVQVYRGFQAWKQEQRTRTSRDCAISTLPMSRIEFPTTIVTGALFALGCSGYLVWSVFIG
jgi:hypothetical protein